MPFTVTTTHDTYDIYTLADTEAGSSARIAPARGGIAIGFEAHGHEAFYLDRDSFIDSTKNVRGGNPILFPLCGPLQDNRIEWDGKEYTIGQHGYARLLPWSVKGTSTEGKAAVDMELRSNEQTLQGYPWKFRLNFRFELQGNTLRLVQQYSNQSDTTMPIHIGFHPYFRVSDKSALKFDIPATRFQDTTNWTEHDYNGTFDFDKDVIDVVFLDIKGSRASFTDPNFGVRVSVEFEPAFRYVVFWTQKGKDFVCVEPWSGRRFTLNSGEDLIEVPPGGTFRTGVSYRIDKA